MPADGAAGRPDQDPGCGLGATGYGIREGKPAGLMLGAGRPMAPPGGMRGGGNAGPAPAGVAAVFLPVPVPCVAMAGPWRCQVASGAGRVPARDDRVWHQR